MSELCVTWGRARAAHLRKRVLLPHIYSSSCTVYIIWSSLSAEYRSTGYGCETCSRSAEQEKCYFPCPRSRRRILSRETGLGVLSRVNPIILHTQAESSAYSRYSSRLPRRIDINRHTPSGRSRVYRSCICVPMAFTADNPPAQGQ